MVRVCLSLASTHERDPLTSAHRSLAPDVLIDASKVTAEQAVATIDTAVKAAFPEERPSGVDGECQEAIERYLTPPSCHYNG